MNVFIKWQYLDLLQPFPITFYFDCLFFSYFPWGDSLYFNLQVISILWKCLGLVSI